MAKRGFWKSRLGFYLVAIGTALGIGNMWRFPYVVGENGGGAFLLLYLFVALSVGLPLLIAELSLGQKTQSSVLQATAKMGIKAKRPFEWMGRLAWVNTLIVLSYYSVISGWVLHFLMQFIVVLIRGEESMPGLGMTALYSKGWLQMMLASVHILITLIVILRGVHGGLERWLSAAMPLFGILVVILVSKSLSLPSSSESVRFLFYPNFSKLTLSSLAHAVGHVFFTLSIGFGTMVTFGSYMRKEDHVPSMGFRVTIVDTIVSVIAVLLVFPAAFQASTVMLTDPSLLFESLPGFLLSLPGGAFFGLLFFMCLYFSALNASIGLFESLVANVTESFPKYDRKKSTWIAGALCLLISIMPALSGTVLERVNLRGKSVIEILDAFTINWALPIIALGVLISFLMGTTETEREAQFVDQSKYVSVSMYSHWRFALRWLAPTVIIVALLLQAISVLR